MGKVMVETRELEPNELKVCEDSGNFLNLTQANQLLRNGPDLAKTPERSGTAGRLPIVQDQFHRLKASIEAPNLLHVWKGFRLSSVKSFTQAHLQMSG